MFLMESSLTGAATVVDNRILVKDAEAISKGEALVAAAGRLTKCGATAAPQFIALQSSTAGTNKQIDYMVVRKDQTFLADIAGTASLVAAVTGAKVVSMDATGLKVDSAALIGGAIEIVSVDTANSKCRVRFNL